MPLSCFSRPRPHLSLLSSSLATYVLLGTEHTSKPFSPVERARIFGDRILKNGSNHRCLRRAEAWASSQEALLGGRLSNVREILNRRWFRVFVLSDSFLIFRSVALTPFHLVPMVGILISAWLRALGTAQHLHKPVCLFLLVFSRLWNEDGTNLVL